MPEIAFYHHTTRAIEQSLSQLLEKSLARGWRVVVQAATPQRVKQLDDFLWSYAPESFLPHGTGADADPRTQPIYLTCEGDNPNGADARFFLDGVRLAPILSSDAAPRERVVLLFSGEDDDSLEAARAQWKELKAAGHALVYYQQGAGGGWIEKAREPKA